MLRILDDCRRAGPNSTHLKDSSSREPELEALVEWAHERLGDFHWFVMFPGSRGEQLFSPAALVPPMADPARLTLEGRGLGSRLVLALDQIENPIVRTFRNRLPYFTERYGSLWWPRQPPEDAARVQSEMGIRSVALLPLEVGDRCIGVLAVASQASVAGLEARLLDLRVIARRLAGFWENIRLAQDNARLHQELRGREQQVSILLKATIDAQEEERERICLEIHDGVAQTLAPAFHYLQTLEVRADLPEVVRLNVRKASALVRDAIREARDVIATLRPAALDTLGLVETLRYQLETQRDLHGWQVDFRADQARFPKSVETTLYRIINEAVNNVAKHAQARNVRLHVRCEQGYVIAEVQDDGIGFDPPGFDNPPSTGDPLHRQGVGLLSMRKRAELLQGNFNLESSPGRGTTVHIEVPLLSE